MRPSGALGIGLSCNRRLSSQSQADEVQEREPGIWTVAMGTGAGFAPPVHVESHYGLEPSRERSVCGALGEAGEIAATPTGLYDIDGDGQAAPLTDGLMLLRYLFGFRGAILVANALGADCERCNGPAIEGFIGSHLP